MDDMIESLAEIKMNKLDFLYLNGIISEEQYEAEIKARQELEGVKVILPDQTENLTNNQEN
jgi:hypothetical protein